MTRIHFNNRIVNGKWYDHSGPKIVLVDTWPGADETIESSWFLRFKIDYPLSRPVTIERFHVDGNGWTQKQFVEMICRVYADIYAAEDDPGHIPGMLNRGKSEGPYGIWGHDIGDLVLEYATKVGEGEDAHWQLGVGS